MSVKKPAETATKQEEELVHGDSKGSDKSPDTESHKERTETVAEKKAETTTAKAGKRSAKAIAEAEAKQAKEERKSAVKEAESTAETKLKVTIKPARSRIERAGKKFRKAAEQVDRSKEYPLQDGLALAVATSPVKFDATVEMHINLGVDPRHADQNVRDSIVLPNGSGKQVRVAVFAEADDVAKAKKAGADIADGDEFLVQLDKNMVNFDVLIATPTVMPKLGKYARMLGPKGLMPNPKSGTVTSDVTKAVTEAKAGRVEYRVDSAGIVHLGIGKVSFGAQKLQTNAEAVLKSIRTNKPASLKGTYVQAIHLSTTMGPSIRIQTVDNT